MNEAFLQEIRETEEQAQAMYAKAVKEAEQLPAEAEHDARELVELGS